ncbi:Aste57867_8851 [Aphanomyces stellatus]|uniref:Conserved oligomeric Golgi complex subunit 3 n=1 Tax=Aphanomyces stellatus TaxID=120398 RepID=A0A485KLI5_9STRA|nr:hypothetical protein As57867_008816 [Aphanomyces stellatus]VFT85737.1 Aste57867_8851 [Aphanomyces stellatus]
MTLSAAQEALLQRLEEASHASSAPPSHSSKAPMSLKQYFALQIPATPQVAEPLALSPAVQQFVAYAQTCYRACEAVEDHTQKSIALLQEMEDRHVSVTTLTSALYESFETLLKELEALNVKVKTIDSILPYFTRLSAIAKAVGGKVDFSSKVESNGSSKVSVHVRPYSFGSIDPTSPSFEQGIHDIDECAAFLQQHSEFKDTPMYLTAYSELMANALHTLKDYAIATLETARDQVAVGISKQPINPQSELDEASIYYIQFNLAASACQAITKHMDQRETMPGNDSFLPDVLDTYVSVRNQLLTSRVSAYLAAVNQSSDIVNLLRIGCQYMVRLCQTEYQLFVRVFGVPPTAPVLQVEDQEEDAFQRLIFQLSATLYHTVRPRMIQQHNLEMLCEIIEVLRSEVVETHIRPRGAAAEALEPVVERMVGDAQERLILCTQKFIRDEIEEFVPTPADLNYPDRLQAPSVYATWYPTLEHTLTCLSKVYRYVNMHIFEELAQDAVRICTASLKMASADITVQKGNLDGGLFLVKHLLTLRERITPFDIQFAVTEKNLDFSSTTDAMGNILNGNILTDAFTFSLDNSILGLITHGIPHVNTVTSDVKKDLEHELKKSCTIFIEYAIQLVASPLVGWLQKANATLKTLNPSLRTQAHATPDTVGAMLEQLMTRLQAQIPVVQHKIREYLANASTESILFKPVQKGLMDVMDQLKAILEKEYKEADRTAWEAEMQAVLQHIMAM